MRNRMIALVGAGLLIGVLGLGTLGQALAQSATDPPTHEQLDQAMDATHGPGTAQRMHEAMGQGDAQRGEQLMGQCVSMMGTMQGGGMMQGGSGGMMGGR